MPNLKYILFIKIILFVISNNKYLCFGQMPITNAPKSRTIDLFDLLKSRDSDDNFSISKKETSRLFSLFGLFFF